MPSYDLAVIGAGPGGYVAAIRAAQLGGRVVLIDKDELGGTCLNWGCIPTKAMIASAEVYKKIKEAAEFGIIIEGEARVDMGRLIDRKDKIVATLVKGIQTLLKSRGVTYLHGQARFKSSTAIEVTAADGAAETVEAAKTIVSTGSRPVSIPAFPFDGASIISSDDAVNLRELPSHLLIIGAGIVGCEFAFLFNELGCRVTMVEMMERALPFEDGETSRLIERELKKRKIALHSGTKVDKAERQEDGVVLTTLEGGETVEADLVLVSIGRRPNTDGLGLEAAGVDLTGGGEIVVNERMQSSTPAIYAIGDVVGGAQLAHKASAEGIVAAENAMGRNRVMNYDVIPAGIFTIPEVGVVGITEEEAEKRGLAYRVGRFPIRALGKAMCAGETVGQVKVIAEEETDLILGVHIVGDHAADLIHEAAVAMHAGMTASELGDLTHAHPTLAEAIMEAVHDVHGMAIHIPPKREA
ncbi:MAG: dihydrolipoyl dehydrogenase [Nitrospinae bacterium]|nr:dihydrolipoyl dehydrogenase [Nitrospinota bacterium]